MTEYRCTWERPDNPTARMNDTDARAYWKAHAVEFDCAFALESTDTPVNIRAAWQALLGRVLCRGKETPDDRRIVESLRAAWRTWMAGRPYRVPVVEPVAVRKPRAGKAGVCPQCGGRVAVAA